MQMMTDKFRCPRNARFRGAMSSQQHTTQEVCCWYLGAHPSRGVRARARDRACACACARSLPRLVGV